MRVSENPKREYHFRVPEPALDYQDGRDARSEKRAKRTRKIKLAARVIVAALGLVIVLGISFMLYETLRHKTTLSEVQGWMATLPSNAGKAEVQQLFAAKGMTWELINPGQSPVYFEVSSDSGLRGCVPDADRGWMWRDSIFVFVTFDQDGRIKSTRYYEWGIGP